MAVFSENLATRAGFTGLDVTGILIELIRAASGSKPPAMAVRDLTLRHTGAGNPC